MTTRFWFYIGDRVRTKPGVLAAGQAEGVIMECPFSGAQVRPREYGVRITKHAVSKGWILGFDADELEALS